MKDDRLAVVVIHGIGEQRPMNTLTGFAEAAIQGARREGEPKFWSKPDRMSESFELRRLTTRKTELRPTTDFYEYYWAHRMVGTSYKHIVPWLRHLLCRKPATLIQKVRWFWWVAWAVVLISISGWAFLVATDYIDIDLSGAGLTVLIAAVPMIAAFIADWLFLGYLGDAARYLSPDPENIAVRHDIRADGIELLRTLHKSGKYTRIIVVGHSLGSVIAYDILKHLWDEFNHRFSSGEGSALQRVEAQARELEEQQNSSGADPADLQEKYRAAQRDFWEELQQGDHPWLVSDLVTLGSPLVHATYLLAENADKLQYRQTLRELPTCPPVLEAGRISYQQWKDGHRTDQWVPHHAALFGCTVWTNLYFEGDAIGDKLGPCFGLGIEDVQVSIPGKPRLSRSVLSHTWYWKESDADDTESSHIRRLRKALTFA